MAARTEPAINPVYDRTDPRGYFPCPTGLPDIEHNRLAIFWRPLIDMAPSPYAPMRLQAIGYVNDWLADEESTSWAWFARHSVVGLRTQVIRHAGLAEYACRDPRELPDRLRTRQWRVLVDALDRFADLPPLRRRLVIFQLVQLSFNGVAAALSADHRPDGSVETDHYLYEVARANVYLSAPTQSPADLFEHLATRSDDPVLRLAAAGQGISYAVRMRRDLELARRFESYGEPSAGADATWLDLLMTSRFHRAAALLRMRERNFAETHTEVMQAWELSERLFSSAPENGPDQYVAVENRRIVLESLIKAASRAPDPELTAQVRRRCDQLLAIDPHCLQARMVVADGYAAIGSYEEAARWYTRVGELGTGAGAMAWYRAGQCYHILGRLGDAVNAMGRCLELDTTAVQPREYLEQAGVSA